MSIGAGDAQTIYAARFTDRADTDDQARTLRDIVGRTHAISLWTGADDNKRISTPQDNISSLQSASLPVSVVFFLLGGLIIGLAAGSMQSDPNPRVDAGLIVAR